MQVKVIPTAGRKPYLAALTAPPQFTSLAFGGYSTATISAKRVKGGDLRGHLLYADVEIWGDQGSCWRGVVESSDSDGTLHCVGPQQVLGWYPFPSGAPNANIATWMAYILGVGPYLGAGFVPAFLKPTATMPFALTNSLTLSSAFAPSAGTVADAIAQVTKYDEWEWGFYHELIEGVWSCEGHYNAPSTTPDYIVTLSAEDAATFMGDSLDNMTSRVVTEWGATPTLTTTQDTNADHYLVQIGRDKTQFVTSSNTQSAADAALIANAAIAKKAKTKAGKTAAKKAAAKRVVTVTAQSNARQLSGVNSRAGMMWRSGTGSEKTSRIQLANGLPAYLPNVRPGTLARMVGLPTGAIDLRIAGTANVGEHSLSLDLGTDSGRLDALLARVS